MSVPTFVAGSWVVLAPLQSGTLAQAPFSRVAAAADIIVSIALLALIIIAIPTALSILKLSRKATALVDRVEGDVASVLRSGSAVSEDVRQITSVVRGDIQEVHATVSRANGQARQALDHVESRARAFAAATGELQDEIEGLMGTAVSAVQGAKAGAAALRSGVFSRLMRWRPRKRHEEEDDFDDDRDEEDDEDGDDAEAAPPRRVPAAAAPKRNGPRIRRRPGRGHPVREAS